MTGKHDGVSIYRETSADAWEWFGRHVTRTDLKILRVVARPEGATCDEVERVTGLRHQTASGQIRHLVERAFVRASASRRATRSGRRAIVWRLVGVDGDPPPQPPQPPRTRRTPQGTLF